MNDLISRREAIDGINTIYSPVPSQQWIVEDCLEIIERLPSAQPEIIKCNACKWYELPSHGITENCVKWLGNNGVLLPIKPTDFCSYAERRTDERFNQ